VKRLEVESAELPVARHGIACVNGTRHCRSPSRRSVSGRATRSSSPLHVHHNGQRRGDDLCATPVFVDVDVETLPLTRR